MALRYTTHARIQMTRRGLVEADVEAALRRRIGQPEPGNRPDTIVIRGYSDGGSTLKIVVDSVDQDLIVSAMTA